MREISDKELFELLKTEITACFFESNSASSPDISEWKGQDIVTFQEDLFEKINLEDYTNAQKLASCYHSYVRNAIIEADEKSTQESDEGHRVKAAFRKSGSKSAY